MGRPISEYKKVAKTSGEVNGVPQGNEFWVIREGEVVHAVNFLCPCGCGRECYTPVKRPREPRLSNREWSYDDATFTVEPSIRYLSGCKTHFNIQAGGKVLIHADSRK